MKRKCWLCEDVKECLYKVYVTNAEGNVEDKPLCKMCKDMLNRLNESIDFRGSQCE